MKKLVSTAVALCLIFVCTQAMAKAKKSISGVVNINTAGIAELTMLPGVGPSKAQAIVDYRKDHPFQKTEDLKEVKGIGDKLFASIQQYIAVSGSTTATAGTNAAGSVQPAKVAPGMTGKAF